MQKSITNTANATGIVGTFSRSNDQDAHGAILVSATEANNVVGRAVKSVATNANEVGVAASGNLAGLLVTPKIAYRPSLAAQAFLPNGMQCEVATKGYVFVNLLSAANAGDFVYYSDTTGELISAAPGVAPAAGYTRLNGGLVKRLTDAAGFNEIYFDLAGSTETPTA